MSYDNTTAYQCIQALANKGKFTAEEIVKLTQYPNLSGIRDIINGKAEITYSNRNWQEENGVIHLAPMTSDGTTGPDWIERLEKQGHTITKWAKDVLLSPDFKPTSGVTYDIAVLMGKLFTDADRSVKNIRAEANKRKLTKPNAEVACLIREMYTDEELKAMGLWYLVTMHEPINDSVGDPLLLRAYRSYGVLLGTYCGEPGSKLDSVGGFAFVVLQVSSSS